MENNFDRLIKQKLENLEVEYNPSDWDRMEEKIVEQSELNPAIEDVYLDGMVYDTLNDVNVQYNPAHWEMMKNRLEDPYAIRRRLMKYKVLEVALVALLLITIGRLVPFDKSKSNTSSETTAQIADAKHTLNSDSNTAKIAAQENNSTEGQSVTGDQVTLSAQQNPPTIAIAENNEPEQALSNEGLQDVELSEYLKNNTSENNNNELVLTEDKAANINEILAESVLSEAANEEVAEQAYNFGPVVAMDALELKEAGPLMLPQEENLDGRRVLNDLPKTINVRIGMVLGPDANYVTTPSNQSKDLDVFNQYALGYSGGFTLGFNYGRWEIETGALYSAVSYDSRNIYEIKGSFADGGYVQQGLEGAQLDIVRVPLNIKYNFADHSKWNVYAYSGVSANAAVETFYKITTTDLGLSDASRNFAGRTPSPPDIEPQKAEENFDGVFEGGLLSKNLFYTANLGLGVERYFTPRMSVFLQPNFQYQFSKGLGPQSDRINSVSLLMGAKVTLKKRKK